MLIAILAFVYVTVNFSLGYPIVTQNSVEFQNREAGRLPREGGKAELMHGAQLTLYVCGFLSPAKGHKAC